MALVALVGVGVVLLRFTPVGGYFTREGALAGIEQLRSTVWAPLIFVALYAAAMVFALPGTIFTLTGGVVFGFWWGLVLNTLGANLGANAAFVLARFLGRGGVRGIGGEAFQRHMARLDEATAKHGFRGLLVLRLIPVVPFNVLNFGSALTAIPWRAYAAATLLGILPGTAVYTLFADALVHGVEGAARAAFVRALIAGALLAVLALLPLILKRMKISTPGTAGTILLMALACGPPAPAHVEGQAPPSHEAFTQVLEAVVRMPLVDYLELQQNRQGLDAYVEALGRTDPRLLEAASREERLAFWLNAYNACMLRLVVDHYPIEPGGVGLFGGIRNRVAGYPDNSVWQIRDVFTRRHCPVAGSDRSQDGIEHEIIRPRFGDPRIHFAVNCAARSCPVLWPEAYRGDGLDEQLERAVRHFVAAPEHFRLEPGPPPALTLNRVLEWYAEDFGGVERLGTFFETYVEGEARATLADPGLRVAFSEYDWTLNDVPR